MTKVARLGLLGGEPRFAEKLHVGRPNVGDREQLLESFNDILDRRWFSNGGRYVRALEGRLEEYLGVRNCVVTSNATVGLEIAARAVGLAGEVIVPAFTFVATAHALRWLGLKPVFCDVDPETHSLDPDKVEDLITSETSAILGVHLWGRPCDTGSLARIADDHGVRLMYDAAHAFGCSQEGRMIGNFGEAEVFSFHATKFFNTLEGGAIATNDDALAERVRLMKNFGFSGYDEVSSLGINGKMNEVSAAMGLASLDSLDHFLSTNKRNYYSYKEKLKDLDGLSLVDTGGSEIRNYQYVVLRVNESEAGLSRDDFLRVLWAENVIARRYFYPGVHRMEPYVSEDPDAGKRLPVTETLCREVLVLPSGTAVGEQQVGEVCDVIRTATLNVSEIRAAIAVEDGDLYVPA